jgi:hypothetical protein
MSSIHSYLLCYLCELGGLDKEGSQVAQEWEASSLEEPHVALLLPECHRFQGLFAARAADGVSQPDTRGDGQSLAGAESAYAQLVRAAGLAEERGARGLLLKAACSLTRHCLRQVEVNGRVAAEAGLEGGLEAAGLEAGERVWEARLRKASGRLRVLRKDLKAAPLGGYSLQLLSQTMPSHNTVYEPPDELVGAATTGVAGAGRQGGRKESLPSQPQRPRVSEWLLTRLPGWLKQSAIEEWGRPMDLADGCALLRLVDQVLRAEGGGGEGKDEDSMVGASGEDGELMGPVEIHDMSDDEDFEI